MDQARESEAMRSELPRARVTSDRHWPAIRLITWIVIAIGLVCFWVWVLG